tara:strand:+ start:248 stop:1075 length:828 start_codon:yes stop_codon:yes gene_type:complete
MADFVALAEARFPGLPVDFLNLWTQYYQIGKPETQVISEVRKDPEYQNIFPGNTTATGQVRYDEITYNALKESYIGTLQEYGIDRSASLTFMADKITGLIEGDVSADEFAQRVGSVYTGIEENIPQVQEFYETNFGVTLDARSILAGALDPTVGEAIVQGRITTAQIGGEAARAGFEITTSEAKRLQEAGLTQEEARRLFSVAEAQLPRLQELQAQRGVTQEQQIGLEELSEALVFQSQEEMETISRLEEQEASEFAPTTGATRTGRRVTGLTEL